MAGVDEIGDRIVEASRHLQQHIDEKMVAPQHQENDNWADAYPKIKGR